MTATWISPWSGEKLTAEELVREVALDALSQVYLLTLLGQTDPHVILNDDSVVVTSEGVDYTYSIPFPKIVSDSMECGLTCCMDQLKTEYRIPDCLKGSGDPCGEKVGAMLRYYKALDRLVRIVSAVRCWDRRKVLVLHGVPPSSTLSTLKTDLKSAGFHYLVIHPDSGEAGSGNFKVIDIGAAITLLNSLWPREPGTVEEFFNLKRNFGRHSWISDDNMWVADESVGVDEGTQIG
jgi:hypothetical protein